MGEVSLAQLLRGCALPALSSAVFGALNQREGARCKLPLFNYSNPISMHNGLLIYYSGGQQYCWHTKGADSDLSNALDLASLSSLSSVVSVTKGFDLRHSTVIKEVTATAELSVTILSVIYFKLFGYIGIFLGLYYLLLEAISGFYYFSL